jgi:hypothetical protein
LRRLSIPRLGMPRSTAREALRRAESAGLCWPLPEGMTDAAPEAALYATGAASEITGASKSRSGPAGIAS